MSMGSRKGGCEIEETDEFVVCLEREKMLPRGLELDTVDGLVGEAKGSEVDAHGMLLATFGFEADWPWSPGVGAALTVIRSLDIVKNGCSSSPRNRPRRKSLTLA